MTRRTSLAALLSLALFSASAALAAPVSFRGLDCDATGSATALVWSPRSNFAELRCTGIGSSGQDGVSVLTGSDCGGWAFDFGPVPDGASTPDAFMLSLFDSTDPAAPPFVTWTQSPVAGRVRCVAETPGALDWVVEVWSGDELTYSVATLSPPVVDLPSGVSMCEASVAVGMAGGLALSSARDIEAHLKALGLLSVNAVAVTGDRVRVTAHCATPTSIARVGLTGSYGGGGGGGGGSGGFSVAAHTKRFGIGISQPAPPLGLAVDDGTVLGSPPAPETGARVLQGPGMDVWRVAYGDLTRPAALLRSWGMTVGTFDPLKWGLPGAHVTCVVPSSWSDGPDTSRVVVADDGSGAGLAIQVSDVSTAPGSKGLVTRAYSGSARLTLSELPASVPTVVHVASAPGAFHLMTGDGSVLMRCPLPPGTVVFSGGLAWPCDSLEFEVVPGGSERCNGVHPGWLLGHGQDQCDVRFAYMLHMHQHASRGGVSVTAAGDATIQPLGGGVVIHGMSAGGGGGAVFSAPNGAVRTYLKDKFQDGDIPTGQDFTALSPLPGGGSEEVSSLRLAQSNGPAGMSLRARVECRHLGNGRLFVQLSDGTVVEPQDCDDDGDGWMDFRQVVGGTTSMVGSASYRRDSPWTECFDLTFNAPVLAHVRGGDRYLIGLRVWRNRGGEHLGTPAPPVDALRLNGLPPGEPVLSPPGVCALEIDEFELSTAGAGVEAHGPGSTIGGYPVVETWCALADSGGTDCDDTDGFLSLTARGYQPVVMHKRYPQPGPLGPVMRGVAFTADLAAAEALSPSAGFEVAVGGTAGGTPEPQLATFLSKRGYDYYKARGEMMSVSLNTILVRCYSEGALTAEFPQPDSIELTRAPRTALVGDLDGDGTPEIVCTDFPAGTQVHPPGGGPDEDCDRMVLSPLGPVGPFTLDGTAVARLNGLPPGVPVTGVRLATIPAIDPALAVPPAGPARSFALARPWPNPARGALRASFSLPAASRVRACVLDVAGRVVVTLADARFAPGEHVLAWDGRTSSGAAAPAGVYFLRVDRDGREALNARFTQLR